MRNTKNKLDLQPTLYDLTQHDSRIIPSDQMKVSTTFTQPVWEALCDASVRFNVSKAEIIRRSVTDAMLALQ